MCKGYEIKNVYNINKLKLSVLCLLGCSSCSCLLMVGHGAKDCHTKETQLGWRNMEKMAILTSLEKADSPSQHMLPLPGYLNHHWSHLNILRLENLQDEQLHYSTLNEHKSLLPVSTLQGSILFV